MELDENNKNKQVHFCPLETTFYELGTFLSITPKNTDTAEQKGYDYDGGKKYRALNDI